MQHLGWIGLGKMGLPMAAHLIAAGYSMRAFNRTLSKVHDLKGAKAAETPALAAHEAGIVFSMLADDHAVREMLLGDAGAIHAMAPGTILVEMSTISPDISTELATACEQAGVGYLRAPVSGSTAFAKVAKLTVVASGPEPVYAAVLPALQQMSATQYYVGPACEARALKLVLNMMVGVSAAMVGEAMALGLKYGLDRSTMLDVIGGSAVASPLIGYKLAMLSSQDYSANFEARMMGKDFDLMLDAARGKAVPMPLTAQVRQGFSAMEALGDGDEDFFKYAELAASLAGLTDQKG